MKKYDFGIFNDRHSGCTMLFVSGEQIISMSEDIFAHHLEHFFVKYFDPNLSENKLNRYGYYEEEKWLMFEDEFHHFGSPNYYTYKSIKKILKEIKQTIKIIDKYYFNDWLNHVKGRLNFCDYERYNEDDYIPPQKEKQKRKTLIRFYKKFIKKMEKIMKNPDNVKKIIAVAGP